MLSIIVCSRFKTLSEAFLRNISETVQTEYEIICIDNSLNQYSIFEAYNLGATQSQHPYLCFVHDDVCFHSSGWGPKLIEQLQNLQIGIIGLAGRDVVGRVPASWSPTLDAAYIIQSYKSKSKKSKKRFIPTNFNASFRPTLLLDGVFLSMRKELMNTLKFDETLGGFHGYDFDICIQAAVAGYTNAVTYDLELEHYSEGDTSAAYFTNLVLVFKKWSSHLPLSAVPIAQCTQAMEERALWSLLIKLTRRSIPSRKICTDISYFGMLIKSQKFLTLRNYLPIAVFIIRLIFYPVFIFRINQKIK